VVVPLIVVQDQHQPCPYLENTTARMPLRLPLGEVKPEATDQLLALGFRRSGEFVYRAECPSCDQCKPTRVDIHRFRYTRSLRRVLSRGRRDLVMRWGDIQVDSHRVWMFNQHRFLRGLAIHDEPVDAEGYQSFLANTCCRSQELAMYHGDRLIGVSIVDVGQTSLSAVYTHFDPAAGRYCLGTLAVLEQFEWAREHGRTWVYLGMYVAQNQHLNYKARFMPQQRLERGQWVEFDEPLAAARPTQV
jgi:arginyl-tRNA--protein-N-Asp/Glu arginylyltransferase